MNYEEFSQYKEITDSKFVKKYECENGNSFFVEPAFYTQLQGFKDRHPIDEYQRIINRMIEIVKKNKKVVFVGNFEYPQTEVEGFIFLEITDITDPLQIFVEDKSRGSDYGD